MRDEKFNTAQWIKPPVTRDIKKGNQSPLSYQMPEKPFEIYKEDFIKTAMDYMMFEQGIDVKELEDSLIDKVLYSSDIQTRDDTISISLKTKGN